MRSSSQSPELSIVIPVYNGAKTIEVLVSRLRELDIDGGLEIILVNDASQDNSLSVCRELLNNTDVPITVVDLARNFGEHNAVLAGYAQAKGRYIINMDDDLQNPPEEVIALLEHAKNGSYDVVYTQFESKKHANWRNLGSTFTNLCADYLLDKPKGLYLSSFRCINQFTLNQVLSYQGPFPYVDGLILQSTQNIGVLSVKHLERSEGESNYTFRRLIRLFLSMALNFSVKPLRAATILGIIVACIGILFFVYVFLEAVFTDTPQGWASLMSVLLLLSGVQLTMLGVLGEYIGRLYLTTNNKPQYIIRSVENNSE